MSKKRILILAYYFPPCNSIGARRPVSWARYFTEQGYDVTVVSRHWSGELNEWADWLKSSEQRTPEMVEKEGYRVLYLPYTKTEYPKGSFAAKINTFKNFLTGRIQPETDGLQYLPFLKEHLEKESYDLMIATAEPYNLIDVAFQLNKHFGIPYIADYRDYEDHFVLAKDPQNSLFKKIENLSINTYTKKWTSNASLITSVCYPIADYLGELTGKRSIEITNGYEYGMFNDLKEILNDKVFQFTVLGTIYPKQSLDELFEGVQVFLKEIPNPKIQFNFVGLESIPEVANRMRENMPEKYTRITKRVPREEALAIGKETHVLFYPGFHQYTGFYSGKIFEYLGLKKNILISPGDEAVIDTLIQRTQTGKIAPTGAALGQALIEWYREWEQNGTIAYHGIDKECFHFSRENQARLLLDQVEEILGVFQESKVINQA